MAGKTQTVWSVTLAVFESCCEVTRKSGTSMPCISFDDLASDISITSRPDNYKFSKFNSFRAFSASGAKVG